MSLRVARKKIWTGVAEWEEPRHSGRLLGATVPHFLPLGNTVSHLSVRWPPNGRSMALCDGESERLWEAVCGHFLQFALHRQGRVPQPRWGSRGCNGGKRTRNGREVRIS